MMNIAFLSEAFACTRLACGSTRRGCQCPGARLPVGTASTAAVFRQANFLAADCRLHEAILMVVFGPVKRLMAPRQCPAFAPDHR